ncbi:TerD family protein [Streptomyces natalensis]|uniref:TerD-family protein n=1 Tax=Streptomyces natalensis ATCC 27448 TaxID=1240678 RepID=A0A0D7CDU0_9ACTN|nr:TerD family protein [Streptomyces natalensis]KIZ13532.1 TerD-family protein [Streptomyces natalensis ATCC 27448]
MSVALTKGGNVSLSKQAPGLTAVSVGLGWQVGGSGGAGYDLDASALLCDQSGRALSDQHFVFFNNLRSPDGSVRHCGSDPRGGSGGDDERIEVDLTAVPAGVAKIVFPVSLYEAEQRGQNFGQVRSAYIRVVDQTDGTEIARYDLREDAATETAMVFGELYRHGSDWKFRAIGQGYAAGLAGIAQDFGVDVLRPDPAAAAQPAAPTPPTAPPAPPAAAASPVTAAAATGAAAATAAATGWETPGHGAATTPPQPTGSSAMTCFFDPNHGPGMTPVMWSPQWGVPRQIQTCAGCAQRVQTTPPPYYTAPQAGYPQPAQQGYPQAPMQQGYPQDPQQQGGGRRFGAGALIGAGAAGLVGGALLNEAFDDDEPEVIVNNYYED